MLDNYLKYREQKPSYKTWKSDRDALEAKRQNYIKNNNISDAQKASDMARAKAVLNAVDIMDEYSQSKAEDMENTVNGIKSAISYVTSYASMGLGALLSLAVLKSKHLSSIDSNAKAAYALAITMGTSILASLGLGAWTSTWSVKKETEASRKGRFEAMRNDLNNPKQFAQLTEAQEKQVNEIAKDIKIEAKEAKKIINNSKGNITGALDALKSLREPDMEYIKQRKEFSESLEKDKAKFDTVKLSEEEILEAKKDQQLIQNIVEKIDVASQDYAEDVELLTSSVGALSLGSGALGLGLGALIGKITKSSKATGMGALIGVAASLPFAFWATGVQKQASRVARWKVKQDFIKNPEKIYYVDDEKVKNEKVEAASQEEKLGYFEKIKQIIKDDKEYKEYIKTENVKAKQRHKAIEKIEITPEQEKRARQLQNNIFKMFNKVDEKSQMYSESTEGLSEIVQNLVGCIPAIGMIIATIANVKNTSKNQEAYGKLSKNLIATLIITIIPSILINKYATKEQKNASRVADMLAIKEMEDYRNFADYNSKDTFKHSLQAHQG